MAERPKSEIIQLETYFHVAGQKFFTKRWGNGPELLIAFHGFAHDHKQFNILVSGLSKRFTVYAVDLPFHGKSRLLSSYFNRQLILLLIRQILEKEHKQRFSCLGYSLGARIWLSVLPRVAPLVEAVYLLSPDGIRTQWLGTGILFPRFVISWIQKRAEKPERFTDLAERLNRYFLISKFSLRFTQFHLKTPFARQRLFGTWKSLSALKVYKSSVQKRVRAYNIKICIITGKRDPLLSIHAIKRFVRKMPMAELHLINKDHNIIDGSIAPIINNVKRIE